MKQAQHNTQPRGRYQAAARARVSELVCGRITVYVFAAAAIAMLSFSGNATAQGIKTLEEAATEIRASHEGARILKAEPKTRSDGSKVFRFRLLTRDGMVKTIKIESDNATGDGKPRRKKKRRQ